MNKRYQVFVSSTFTDLAAERMEVIKALLELDCIPCGMEYFPAASEDTWHYISDLIKQCDYYIVIVAGRYGSLTPEGISFTQKEYECAINNGVPAIAFLCAEPEKLPVKNVDTDPERKQKLEKFVALLKKHLCKEWHNADELGAVVSRSVTQLIKRTPRTGWVPASAVRSVEDANEILELNKKIKELESKLKHYDGVSVDDISSLCDGDDLFELGYTYDICEKTGKYGTRETIKTNNCKGKLSWNKLFSVIAPKITPFEAETAVKTALNKLLEIEFSETVNSGLTLEKGKFIAGFKMTSFSFDTIKVQLQALGLVIVNKEMLEEKNDQERWRERSKEVIRWRLTDKGRNRMYSILALRKDVHCAKSGISNPNRNSSNPSSSR